MRISLATLLSMLVLVGGAVPAAAARPPSGPAERYIVTLADDTDVRSFVGPNERRIGFRAANVYERVARGFAASLDARQVAELRRDPRVTSIRRDRAYELTDQTLPPGVGRVEADRSSIADIDGIDTRVNADIAIIDSGIQRNHPDLNVAGGYNCVSSDRSDWDDVNGHGTHVAGIAAAKDNGIGVVGVAPGARVWALRVFPEHGTSWESWIVCALEWVTAQRDANDPDGALFESVNMSLRGSGGDDGNCGRSNQDLMHRAVCDAVAAGITVVVAAGNDATDAKYWTPAAYDSAITVSAIGDFNGRSGGGASNPCGTASRDDYFATFSNYGADVDITAPGVCVLSTFWGSSYTRISGTSMAAPHVAGAAALFKVHRPLAKPSEVRGALIATGLTDWFTSTDKDSSHERLLDVSSFSVSPSFAMYASPPYAMKGPGGVATFGITAARRGGMTAAIDLSVEGLLPGMSARFASDRLTGTQDTTTLQVTAPSDGPAATATLRIIGRSGSVVRQAEVTFRFEPVMTDGGLGPVTHLPSGTTLNQYSLPVTVVWTPTSGATQYQFQASVFDGAWSDVTLPDPDRPSVTRTEWPGHLYRYRVRALVGGTWQPWRTGRRHSAKDFSGTVMGIAFSGPGHWRMQEDSATYSTRPMWSSTVGATATFPFRGREVSFVTTRGPGRGRAQVYVDGALSATINLESSTYQKRRVVLSRYWPESGSHTIQIKVLSGRIDIDAFIVFN